MKILVLNAGSTSIKFDLYEMDAEDRLAHGMRERVSTAARCLANHESRRR